MKWTNTAAAVAQVEEAGAKGQWKIGDAVIKDLKENNILQNRAQGGGPPEIQNNVFISCAEALAAKGIEHKGKPYAPAYVRDLFQAAYSFSHDERDPQYSWDAHSEAGTPANLKKAATILRKLDKTVTIYNVRELISRWRAEATSERKEKLADAQAAKAKAKAAKIKATDDKLATKEKAAKDEAEVRRQVAIKQIAEAQKEINKNSGAPAFNTDIKLDTADSTPLEKCAVLLGFSAHSGKMYREAKKTLKDIASIAKILKASERKTIAVDCNVIIGILEEINTLVEHEKPRFIVHRGGAA